MLGRRTFFLLMMIWSCGGVFGCAAGRFRSPGGGFATTATVAGETPGIPSVAPGPQQHPIFEPPTDENLDKLTTNIMRDAWHAPPADRVILEQVLRVLERGDRSELGMIITDKRHFTLSAPLHDFFWNAAIEIAEILRMHEGCRDQNTLIARYFFIRLPEMQQAEQALFWAALHFLRNGQYAERYSCDDRVTISWEE